MTERYQLVLHVLMARGALTEANFDSLLLDASRQLNLPQPQGAISDRCKNFANEVNGSLSFASLEVRRAVAENSEEAYWGIVNTKADAIAQIATKYTFVELNMFKKIIDLIVLSPATPSEPRKAPKKRGRVHLNRILTERGGTFTIPQLQRLLDRLVEDMWLWQRGSYYGLGVRAVLELRTYVEEMYGKEAEQQPPQEEPVEQEETIVACTICMEIVFFGEACPQQQCPVKLHRHCLRKYMQNRDTCLCPACRQPWNAPPNAANDADE